MTEDTFEKSFGPFMQIGGKKFVLGLVDRGRFPRAGDREVIAAGAPQPLSFRASGVSSGRPETEIVGMEDR